MLTLNTWTSRKCGLRWLRKPLSLKQFNQFSKSWLRTILQSKVCVLIKIYRHILIVLDKKQRVYVHDDGYWMVKGRFEKALMKNSKVSWNEDDSISILMVMWILFQIDKTNISLSRLHLITRILVLHPPQLQLLKRFQPK